MERFPAAITVSTSLTERSVRLGLSWKIFYKYTNLPIYKDATRQISYGFYINIPEFIRPFLYDSNEKKPSYRVVYDSAIHLYRYCSKLLGSNQAGPNAVNQRRDEDIMQRRWRALTAVYLRRIPSWPGDDFVELSEAHRQELETQQEEDIREAHRGLLKTASSLKSSLFFKIDLLEAVHFLVKP